MRGAISEIFMSEVKGFAIELQPGSARSCVDPATAPAAAEEHWKKPRFKRVLKAPDRAENRRLQAVFESNRAFRLIANQADYKSLPIWTEVYEGILEHVSYSPAACRI